MVDVTCVPPLGDATKPQNDEQRARSGERSGTMPLIPGYTLHELLGEGGMGVVYKATQLKLHRVVALKMVLGSGAGSKELLRFLGEVEAVAQIDHPNVVRIYESGDSYGRPYFTMEHLSGGSLADRIKAGSLGKPSDVAELIRKLALAVQSAHNSQIVHRDLKPANVLFDSFGEPRITDFGLAKRGDGGFTATNAIMGTPAYMAPEQAKGESKFVGPQSDVWALGVMLYECLTGVKPFAGSNEIEILRKVVDDEPSSLRSRVLDLPHDLELIVLKCLTKDPASRYLSAGALAEDLRRWLAGEPISVIAASPYERTVKWIRRNRIAAGIVAASIFGVGISSLLAALAFEQRGEARRFAKRADDETENVVRANGALHQQMDDQRYLIDVLRIKDAISGYEDHLVHYSQSSLQDVDPANRTAAWYFARRMCYGSEAILHAGDTMIRGVAWSPDGTRIATACTNSTAIIWDLKRGQAQHILNGHTLAVIAVCWSNDGHWLASASLDHTIRIWNTTTGALVRILTGHSDAVQSLRWHAGTNRFASSSLDGTVRLWDWDKPKALLVLTATNPVPKFDFSPDGETIVTAGMDAKIRYWDVRTGSLVREIFSDDFFDEFGNLSIAWNPNGKCLATGTIHNVVRVWSNESGTRLREVSTGRDCAQSSPADWSNDGRFLATSDNNGMVDIHSTDNSCGPVRIVAGNNFITGIDWSPDDRKLCYGCEDGSIHIVILDDFARTFRILHHGSEAVTRIGWDTHERLHATLEDGETLAWDSKTDFTPAMTSPQPAVVSDSVRSADGTRLATRAAGHTVHITDAATGTAICTLVGHEKTVHCLAWSPSGDMIVTGSADATIRVWNAKTGECQSVLQGKTGSVTALTWSPDSRLLAAGHNTGTLRLWDVRTSQAVVELHGHQGTVNSITFCPEGFSLLTGGEDGTVRLWDSLPHASYPFLISQPSPADNEYWYLPRGGKYLKIARSLSQRELTRFRRLIAVRPEWQREQAALAELKGDWFAAVFHWKKLAATEPDAASRLRAAEAKLGVE